MTVSRVFSTKMAVKMALFWFSLVLSIIGSQAAGEFTILHSPYSLQFSGSSRTLESSLKEIYSASLGLSVDENSDWEGLSIVDPFNTPEAAVEVYIDGITSLGNVLNAKYPKFPVLVDEYEPDTFEVLKHRIQQRFTNKGSKLVKINLSDAYELTGYPDVFGDLAVPKVTKTSLQHLKYSVEEDYQFLSELEALKALGAKVKSGAISANNALDFYFFRFRSLHSLSDFHGPNSLATKEAKMLLSDALEELSKAFVKAYEGSVLVSVVTTDVAHTRRTIRDTSKDENGVVTEEEHHSDAYSADYAAVFNIMLWFSVVFVFALTAIVYAVMDMDPGRDSIIYRMTSTRMKKE